MMEKEMLYCGNFKAAHCGSCHDDCNYGYPLLEAEGKDFTLEHCCAFKPLPNEDETKTEYLKRLPASYKEEA
jgi:hypothetical protein